VSCNHHDSVRAHSSIRDCPVTSHSESQRVTASHSESQRVRPHDARMAIWPAFSKFLFRWIGALLTPLVLTKSGTKTVVFNAAPARACESDVRSARAPIDSTDSSFCLYARSPFNEKTARYGYCDMRVTHYRALGVVRCRDDERGRIHACGSALCVSSPEPQRRSCGSGEGRQAFVAEWMRGWSGPILRK
jgi:hypothetical protein